MEKLEMHAPAIRDSSGVCDVDVNLAQVQFAADLGRIREQQASATRALLLSLCGAYEIPFIRRVADTLAPRCAWLPWLSIAPMRIDGLRQLDA